MTEVWASSGATSTKRLMMLALADHANDEGWCYPSVIGLATKCCITERNAQLILRELEASGELITEPGAGRGHKNLYWVLPPATQERVALELTEQLGRTKLAEEKVKISALLEKVKSCAEKAKSPAQKVKSSGEKVQGISPEPSVTVSEPSTGTRESEGETADPDNALRSGKDQDRHPNRPGGADRAAAAHAAGRGPALTVTGSRAEGKATDAPPTSTEEVPGGGWAAVDNPVDNPSARYLRNIFRPDKRPDMLDEEPDRARWHEIPVERIRDLKLKAVEQAQKSGGSFRTPLIGFLDLEIARQRKPKTRTVRDDRQAADDEVDAILNGGKE